MVFETRNAIISTLPVFLKSEVAYRLIAAIAAAQAHTITLVTGQAASYADLDSSH